VTYQDNPLRPRSRSKPRQRLSDADLRKYGLRALDQHRTPTATWHSRAKQGPGLMFLIWNSPWILLSRIFRPKDLS
jgi:hypothetical protein